MCQTPRSVPTGIHATVMESLGDSGGYYGLKERAWEIKAKVGTTDVQPDPGGSSRGSGRGDA